MYHSAPNAYARLVLHVGGDLLLLPRFDPEGLLQAIHTYKLSHMHVVPTMFVRLLQLYDDTGDRLLAGESGEIYMSLNALSDFTYHNNDDKCREIDRDGLVTNGDVGYLDADGYLFLNDRKRDMVISGGVNIYPAEIEAVLHDMPGVHDCAVFGIPHDEFGEVVAAAVELVPGAALTAEEVQVYLREHIANYKIPRQVTFHDALPREDTGKIFKRLLRDPYWEQAGRRI
jgi:long-chain acyl-CoA synthetase